ncbi:hypothetical protein [Oceaniglobus indicus]|uniref:hypothetical protein n=1 Tax=Oceaniglobus indicus TaxID=2047749 RepID=UPI0011AB4BA0|nr:hypothetical protein [Oceaniglobus indicus]
MEKQPFQIECFEEAFLNYLRQRFEFEPLAHYVMAAMHLTAHSRSSQRTLTKATLASAQSTYWSQVRNFARKTPTTEKCCRS